MNRILFYRVREPYGEFSNFSPHAIEVKGRVWPTSEHNFLAQKFVGSEQEEAIRRSKSPMIAARIGRSRVHPPRLDWEVAKDEVIREALRAKFKQHPQLRSLLLSTGEAEIIEQTAKDSYWGDGEDGKGKNRLGELLRDLRNKLRLEAARALDA